MSDLQQSEPLRTNVDVDAEIADVVFQIKAQVDFSERHQLWLAIEALTLCPMLDYHQIEQCRRIAADRRRLMNEIALLPAEKCAQHLSQPIVENSNVLLTLEHWVLERRLVRLRINGDWQYATCQIDPATGEPFSALQPVIDVALRQGYTAWETLRWLIEPWAPMDTTPDKAPDLPSGKPSWGNFVEAVMAQRAEPSPVEPVALIELLHRGDIPRFRKQAAIWLFGDGAPVSPERQLFVKSACEDNAAGRLANMPVNLLGLHRSVEVWTRAIDVMGSADLARQWLNKPAIALNHQKPIDVLVTPEGAQQILDLLYGLDYGFYT